MKKLSIICMLLLVGCASSQPKQAPEPIKPVYIEQSKIAPASVGSVPINPDDEPFFAMRVKRWKYLQETIKTDSTYGLMISRGLREAYVTGLYVGLRGGLESGPRASTMCWVRDIEHGDLKNHFVRVDFLADLIDSQITFEESRGSKLDNESVGGVLYRGLTRRFCK